MQRASPIEGTGIETGFARSCADTRREGVELRVEPVTVEVKLRAEVNEGGSLRGPAAECKKA